MLCPGKVNSLNRMTSLPNQSLSCFSVAWVCLISLPKNILERVMNYEVVSLHGCVSEWYCIPSCKVACTGFWPVDPWSTRASVTDSPVTCLHLLGQSAHLGALWFLAILTCTASRCSSVSTAIRTVLPCLRLYPS